MQRNSPFYLTENVEEKIKDMFKEDRKKLVPFYPIINFEISTELSKFRATRILSADLRRQKKYTRILAKFKIVGFLLVYKIG